MFPTIFTVAIEGMGTMSDKASSLLIMAIVGGAVVPVLQGVLADRIGVQHAFVLPLLCYVFIVHYGFNGSRVHARPDALPSPAVLGRTPSPLR
jgi:FHS family L-fucose permease-like MFS transporter